MIVLVWVDLQCNLVEVGLGLLQTVHRLHATSECALLRSAELVDKEDLLKGKFGLITLVGKEVSSCFLVCLQVDGVLLRLEVLLLVLLLLPSTCITGVIAIIIFPIKICFLLFGQQLLGLSK